MPDLSTNDDLSLIQVKALIKDVFGNSDGYDHVHLHSIQGYSIGRVIGQGAFGEVRLVVHHLSRERVAVKIFDKSKFKTSMEERMMRREVRVMRHLTGHDHIVSLLETLEKDRWLYLVMENCGGGNLFEYVSSRKLLQEPEAARISRQLIQALSYCHHRGVVHRDLKLENVMVDGRGNVKLIDLGLSAFFSPDER